MINIILFGLLAVTAFGCTSHDECDDGDYCDTNGYCFSVGVCCSGFCDGIDGTCGSDDCLLCTLDDDTCYDVLVTHVNDNPGYYTCDCVPENESCLSDGECVEETLCPAVDGEQVLNEADLPSYSPYTNVGWCMGVDDHISNSMTADECWAACYVLYGDDLVAIDSDVAFGESGSCYCQDACEETYCDEPTNVYLLAGMTLGDCAEEPSSEEDVCEEEMGAYFTCALTTTNQSGCDEDLDAYLECFAEATDVPSECMSDYETAMECYFDGMFEDLFNVDEDALEAACGSKMEDLELCMLAPGDAECQACFADNMDCYEDEDCDCLCTECLDNCDIFLGEMCVDTKAQCMTMCESDEDDFTLCSDSSDDTGSDEDSVFALASLVVFAVVAIFF